MWPNSRISVMGGEQAASVLLQVKLAQYEKEGRQMSEAEQAEFKRPVLEKYDREGSPWYSTARLWDDGVIDPLDTRATLALGLAASFNRPPEPTNFGIFRM
jgi:acetyl-CoA carboxylase carboxyltransferase component